MQPKNSLLSFFKKNKLNAPEKTPEGYCPNCWGRQEYGGNFYKAVRNYSHDVDSHDPHDGWVFDYAKKHLEGIELNAEGDHVVCPNCKINYVPEP